MLLFPCRKLLLLFIVVLSSSLLACHQLSKSKDYDCLVYRAAFDVGSETTKMKVAKINRCLQKNEGIIYKNETKISYAENHRSGNYTQEIQKAGIAALSRLKSEAMNHKAEAFAGVATESFRQATNTMDFLNEINKQTGISIKLINQDEEAILGYLAATAAYAIKSDKTVVWDIGGSSMQIILRDKNQKFLIYRGKMASVSFKEKIISDIKHQNLKQYLSPNPIGMENFLKAMQMAASASENVPLEIGEFINKQDTVIIGIGGVHNQSIKKYLKPGTTYTQEELLNAIKGRLDLNDEEIGGRYASTDVANLILVFGFMKGLGIKEVIPVDVNLADGVLINPAFW